jgi:hypothetical protein
MVYVDTAILNNASRFEATYNVTYDAKNTSQWITTGSDVYYNSGNVGIGTDAPGTLLDIKDTAPTLRLTDERTDAGWNSGRILGSLQYYTSDTSGAGARVVAEIRTVDGGSQSTGPSGEMAFYTSPNVANIVEAMRIDNAGNVGIGTATPTHLLNVDGTSNFTGAMIVDELLTLDNDGSRGRITAGGNLLLTAALDGTSDMNFGYDASNSMDDFIFYNRATVIGRINNDGSFSFDTPNNGLVGDGSGNVGIGTTAPAYNLEIESASDAALFLQADTGSGTEDRNAYVKYSQDGGAVYGFTGLVGNAGYNPEAGAYTGTLANALLISNDWGSASASVQIGANGAVRMTVDGDGDVGIGDATPSHKLQVVGSYNLTNSSGFGTHTNTTCIITTAGATTFNVCI